MSRVFTSIITQHISTQPGWVEKNKMGWTPLLIMKNNYEDEITRAHQVRLLTSFPKIDRKHQQQLQFF